MSLEDLKAIASLLGVLKSLLLNFDREYYDRYGSEISGYLIAIAKTSKKVESQIEFLETMEYVKNDEECIEGYLNPFKHDSN